MTRDEITKLLELVSANYPQVRIKDPKLTVDSWEMQLGGFDTESVYKAARLHMATSKFFPSPADITEKMVKAKILYSESIVTALPTPAPVEEEKLNEWVDAFCEWIGFGEEQNDNALEDFYQKNPDMRAKMSGILPYEL